MEKNVKNSRKNAKALEIKVLNTDLFSTPSQSSLDVLINCLKVWNSPSLQTFHMSQGGNSIELLVSRHNFYVTLMDIYAERKQITLVYDWKTELETVIAP
jgi:hypothetical protein